MDNTARRKVHAGIFGAKADTIAASVPLAGSPEAGKRDACGYGPNTDRSAA
jgi:hypothetical protein